MNASVLSCVQGVALQVIASGRFKLACIAMACMLLAACGPAPQSAAPRADLQFAIAQETPCAGCREMEQSGPNGQNRIYVSRRPLVVARDIRAIYADSVGDEVFIDFRFVPEAADRIEAMTSKNIGNSIAILAGEQLLVASRLSGPLTDSMRFSGLSVEEHRVLYAAMIEPGDSAAEAP